MANGGLGGLSATLHQYTRVGSSAAVARARRQRSAQRRRQGQVLPAARRRVGRRWDVVRRGGMGWDIVG